MKRALVTGATGFIGRSMVARLSLEGWQVIQAVRTPLGDPAAQTIVLGAPQWDMRTFADAIGTVRPDVVFHLAGTMRARDAAEMFSVNLGLSASLLDAVAAAPEPPSVVLAGSAAEYGPLPQELLPAREDAPCQPLSDYAVSKYAQTLLGLARIRAGSSVLIARIFNPLGAHMPRHLALPNFADQLSRGAATLAVGNLDVARDFIDVDEASRLIVALASSKHNYGKVYNICSGIDVTLRSLLDELIGLHGQPVQVTVDRARLRPGEARRFYGDITRLRAAGLSPGAPDFRILLARMLADRPASRG